MKAIEALNQHEEERAMGRVADLQQYMVRRYAALLPEDRDKDDFGRHLAYLVQLIYREAQQPLVKQLTEFVLTHNRPLIIERGKP